MKTLTFPLMDLANDNDGISVCQHTDEEQFGEGCASVVLIMNITVMTKRTAVVNRSNVSRRESFSFAIS